MAPTLEIGVSAAGDSEAHPTKAEVLVAEHRPGRLAEAAAIVGDDPMSHPQEGRDLPLPGAAALRPAVDQHDGMAGSVILVVEVDAAGRDPLRADGFFTTPRLEMRCGDPTRRERPVPAKTGQRLRGNARTRRSRPDAGRARWPMRRPYSP